MTIVLSRELEFHRWMFVQALEVNVISNVETFDGYFSVPFRRAFVKMSTTPEAFLSLRSHFASSHALLCISHWVLGIGDRHLSNFMINTETGGMIGIDFGHAFGSATQVCMPFSLKFLSLLHFPIGTSKVCLHCIRCS